VYGDQERAGLDILTHEISLDEDLAGRACTIPLQRWAGLEGDYYSCGTTAPCPLSARTL